MEKVKVISHDPNVLMDKPMIAGTRIPGDRLTGKSAPGESIEQIIEALPRLSEEQLIRIRVYLPPYLERSQLDERGYALIEEGSTLGDLFKKLRIPFPAGAVYLCRLNYEKASLKQKLEDGDTVSFFSLISGG